jgi:hypothetical protein
MVIAYPARPRPLSATHLRSMNLTVGYAGSSPARIRMAGETEPSLSRAFFAISACEMHLVS